MDLDPLPPLGCAAIAVIVFIVVSLYFILLAMLRDPQGLNRVTGQRQARGGQTADTLRKATELLRHPFAEENRQLNELSGLVRGLGSATAPRQPGDADQQNSIKK